MHQVGSVRLPDCLGGLAELTEDGWVIRVCPAYRLAAGDGHPNDHVL